MVSRIPKGYHMWGYNDKVLIKALQIVEKTYKDFFLMVMMTKYCVNSLLVFPCPNDSKNVSSMGL